MKKGTILVTIPSKEAEEVWGIETRWGVESQGETVVHEGTFVVTEETADKVHLADLLSSGAPSKKHGHWVKKADLYRKEIAHE